MKISFDAGALCAAPQARYGTYRFTTELLAALEQYGTLDYTGYLFCPLPAPSTDNPRVQFKRLQPARAWMKLRIPLEEYLHPSDVFLGLNQALPKHTKAKLIAFSHGLSFLQFPDQYQQDFPRLKQQLDDYVRRADAIVVSSRAVKKELVEYYPECKDKISILLFGLPEAYTAVSLLKVRKEPYFLYVGSDQPIKNLDHLLETFAKVRQEKGYEDVQLKLVGTNLPQVPIGVSQVQHADLNTLLHLYSSASAYVTVSQYESFNYPVIEALSLGCPVLGYKSAIIPEQRQFTHPAVDQNELIDLMKLAIDGAFPFIDRKALLQRFSWQQYVKGLEKLCLSSATVSD